MTDRINALTVVLETDVRVDDIAPLVEAIKQLRGVISVRTNVATLGDAIARDRARRELRERLWAALEDE